MTMVHGSAIETVTSMIFEEIFIDECQILLNLESFQDENTFQFACLKVSFR